ncbi:hypothetical protein ACLOJK_036751 [Asimina triloba]
MDANNYQWGYQSIYEEDAILAAAAQLAAWKERLEMNGICSTCGSTHSMERCSFAVNDPEHETQNADELVSCSYSQDPNSMMPTPPLPFKQATFNLSEEKALQVEIPTFPPIIRHSSSKGKQGMSKPTGWVETPCLIASVPSSGQGKAAPHRKEDARMQEDPTLTKPSGSYGCRRPPSQARSDRWIGPPQNVAVGKPSSSRQPPVVEDDDATATTVADDGIPHAGRPITEDLHRLNPSHSQPSITTARNDEPISIVAD